MSYPYVEGSHKHMSGPNGAVTRIVIHATCSGTHRGGAMENAHYFQSDNAGGLAHYVVDPGAVVQCCKEDTACWHAPPNHGSVGIELCDPQRGPASRWQSADDVAMLRLAAKLVVEIAHRTGVPLVRLSSADVKAGKHGICGHVNVSEAFHQSSHTDPGTDFPWAYFMDLVHAADRAKPAATHPVASHPFGSRLLLLATPPLSGADVAHVKARLNVTTPGDVYDLDVARAVGNWQRAKGWTVTEKIDTDQQRILG